MTMKKKTIRKLAKEAGFAFWANEPHAPKDMLLGIDWACQYDEQLIKFVDLLEKHMEAKYPHEITITIHP